MATLERGFKAWCERSAQSLRAELTLEPHRPLAARQLAGHLGVELITPAVVPGLPADALKQLTQIDPDGWSAVSFTEHGATTIIYNSGNSSGRQSSDIMHELSHVILGHEPSQVILSGDGQLAMRSFDSKQEDEANWLSWTLLLPRAALMHCRAWSEAEIAQAYEVSTTLVTYRQRVTGLNMQMRRRRGAGAL